MKSTWRVFTFFSVIGLCAGCVGTFQYVEPGAGARPMYVWTVAQSKDDVWRALTAAYEKSRLAFDRLDKDAGAMTLTYRGDPQRYVDCGRINSYVKNLRGERTYRFPAAIGSTEYELMTGKEILIITRKMTLDGRLTIKVVAIGPAQTQVSANADFLVTRTLMVRDTEGRSQTSSDSATFSSGLDGGFPGPLTCRSTGTLETEVASTLGP